MDEYFFRDYKCSECGKRFSFSTQTFYQYKTNYAGHMEYQCGYTCYDHALLRYEGPDTYLSDEKYAKLVNKCERSMKGQGKTILHPIKTK